MVNIGYDQDIVDIINKYGADIIRDEMFEREKNYVQHGITSTYTHSLCVTYISVWMALRSKKKVDIKSIVRGALLHDYFLYDWHEKNEHHNLHGFTHARQSLKNAQKDFELTRISSEIIFCHMFPLNITHIPLSREARIVCIADKLCAACEVLSILRYNTAFAN